MWTMVAAIAESLAAVGAGVAIYMAVRLNKTQLEAHRELQTQQLELQERLHRQQMLLDQRQILLGLWDKVHTLPGVNPQKPVWKDVITAVNTLELIAVCWEGEIVDRDIIRRMYSDVYIETFEQVVECRNAPANVAGDGRKILNACPAVMKMYEGFRKERLERGTVPRLNKEEEVR